jgi:ADP-ribosylglycohydrolase
MAEAADLENTLLYKKVYGCIMGGACGDALGAPLENMHCLDIEAQFGRVEGFRPFVTPECGAHPPYEVIDKFEQQEPHCVLWETGGAWGERPGTYTDDMRFRLLVLQAIVRKGGRIDGMDVARMLLNYRLTAWDAADRPTYSWEIPERGIEKAWTPGIASVQFIVQAGSRRKALWPDWGWDGPLGIVNACRPDLAAEDGYTVAAAVAEAFKPGATYETVVETAIRYAHTEGLLGRELAVRIEKAAELAETCNDVYELRAPFYARFLNSVNAFSTLETVPAALACLCMAKGDPRQAIIGAANLGRDCDSCACIAGEIAGALKGIDALPSDWVEKINEANPQPHLPEVAGEVTGTLLKMRTEEQARVDTLTLMALPGGKC